jgi:hypothetical protein
VNTIGPTEQKRRALAWFERWADYHYGEPQDSDTTPRRPAIGRLNTAAVERLKQGLEAAET